MAPGQIAYEARFAGLTLGPRGVSPAWADLPFDARRTWAHVEAQVLTSTAGLALGDIVIERHRQIATEGWTPDHDDVHTDGSLARAAAAYALIGSLCDRVRSCLYPSSWGTVIRSLWPAAWDETWFKPKDRRFDLVRAGALIVAEIERLDRAEALRTTTLISGGRRPADGPLDSSAERRVTFVSMPEDSV